MKRIKLLSIILIIILLCKANIYPLYSNANEKDTAKLLSVTFFQGEGSTIDEDRVLWNRWREPLYHEDFDDDWMG